MDSSRVAQVKEALYRIENIEFWGQEDEVGETISFTTDYKLSGSEVTIKELEELGFVVFQPRHISDLAISLMEQWGSTHRKYYQDGICTCSMIVDPQQEDKSKLLAEKIIEFYNVDKRNYDVWYDMVNPKYGGKLAKLPPFYDCGELGKILTKVGFIVQIDDDKITVKGNGFSLTVDGKTGEVTENPLVQEDKFKTIFRNNGGKGERFLKGLFGLRDPQK